MFFSLLLGSLVSIKRVRVVQQSCNCRAPNGSSYHAIIAQTCNTTSLQ